MANVTKVAIDFDASHLVFPQLIAILLCSLALAVVVRDRKRILAAGSYCRRTFADMDKQRFLGVLVLTLIYFSLMVPVGLIWPNTGMGFLLCSMPFVFLSGLLCMHQRTRNAIIPLAVVSVAGPVLVWWLFTYPFFLTLP